MTKGNENTRWIPGREQDLRNGELIPYSVALLGFGERKIAHKAMDEFRFGDGWSIGSREAIIAYGLQGGFSEKEIFEAGTGDNRLGGLAAMTAYECGIPASGLVTVEIDEKKLPLAYDNMRSNEAVAQLLAQGAVELYSGDAVQLLEGWGKKGRKFGGTAIACLPQSNSISENNGGTQSDVITNDEWLLPYLADWGSSALHLNAAFLDKLRQVSEPSAEALIVLNHRIPTALHSELFNKTGWQIKDVLRSVTVDQDQDTDIGWMQNSGLNDEGNHFTDVSGNPLTYAEAARIQKAGGIIRHGVSIYRLGI